MINPVKGRTKIYLDKRQLTSPIQFHQTILNNVQKRITATQIHPVKVLVKCRYSRSLQEAPIARRDKPFKNLI